MKMKLQAILAIFVVLFAIVYCQTTWPPPTDFNNQEAQWIRVSPNGAIPPREYHSVVYEPIYNRLIIFGGRTPDGTALNDLWTWSFPARRFLPFQLNGTKPSARSHHVAGYDAARFRMLVFGGKDANGNALNDLWELRLLQDRDTWRQISATPSPSSRWGATGGIFIGSTNGNAFYVAFGKSGFASQRGDVWRFDLAQNSWTDVTGTTSNQNRFVVGSQDAPSPRHSVQGTMLGPDSMMIYGGCASGGYGACPAYDGWLFVYDPVIRNTTWLVAASCPTRAYNGQAAPLPGSGSTVLPRETRMLVFGGYAGTYGGGYLTRQIFEVYDTASVLTGSDRWSRTQILAVTRNRLGTPGPRVGSTLTFVHPLVNNQNKDFLVLFGGRDNNSIVRSDMWYLQGQTITGRGFRCETNRNVRMIHGILMFISFGLFFPSMMLLARYGKNTFLPALRDKSPWLWVHAITNIVGVVITIPALVIVIVAVNSGHFTAIPHAYLGIIIFAMVIFNPIWGAFKPEKDSESRAGWAYVHLWVGRLAIVIGLINILLGILMIRASVVWFALFIVFIFIFLFVYILLEVIRNRREGISCAEALNPKYGNEKYDY